MIDFTQAPSLKLHEHERAILAEALRRTEGCRTKTSELLGVCVKTVRNLIRAYDLNGEFPARPGFHYLVEARKRALEKRRSA